MRLANGIVLDKDTTLEVNSLYYVISENPKWRRNSVQMKSRERTYDLKSKDKDMIQISIPANVPLKRFDYNAQVELINPMRTPLLLPPYPKEPDVDWYIQGRRCVLY